MNLHTAYMHNTLNRAQHERTNITSMFGVFAYYVLVMHHGMCLLHTHLILTYHSTILDIFAINFNFHTMILFLSM